MGGCDDEIVKGAVDLFRLHGQHVACDNHFAPARQGLEPRAAERGIASFHFGSLSAL